MKRVDAAIRLYKHGIWLLNRYKALAETLGNDTELNEAIQDVEANGMAVKSLLNLLVSIDDGETLDENGSNAICPLCRR